jgi:hypothetical protein
MAALLYGVAVLACPIGMGLMMWMMMRGGRNKGSSDTGNQQVAQLRAEIDQLKAERATRAVQEP